MPRLSLIAILLLGAALTSCGGGLQARRAAVDRVAESYVRLALEIGLYDRDFVDAYTGPPEWRPEPLPDGEEHPFPHQALAGRTDALLADLDAVDTGGFEEIERRRVKFLRAHLVSAKGRIDLLGGKPMSFDEESRAIYDVVAPLCDVDSLEAVLAGLEELVPGEGELSARVEAWRERFVIPPDRIDTVFTTAIAEACRRTREQIGLPADERFDVEYVTDASWGAYNWYKGDHRSLIQVNVGLPVRIGSPLGLAVHEGYPGHHVQNVLVETRLLEDRGWVEYYVQPLYCPQAVLNEGGANYGIELVFTREERLAFERDVLYPLAGIDPALAEENRRFEDLTRRLRGAGTDAIRRYLDGAFSAEETIAWLQRYSLMSRERAERYLRFGEQYRSYVATYDVGLEMVRDYMERMTRGSNDPGMRWRLLEDLYAVPHVPSDLE
ncbi:MAG: hypothetical protein PHQ19_03800 [Candidatus Krumholzibacteria bacterium]|nr:hypothetical protein [Candidatus Krumholzibacteria bacterium]